MMLSLSWDTVLCNIRNETSSAKNSTTEVPPDMEKAEILQHDRHELCILLLVSNPFMESSKGVLN